MNKLHKKEEDNLLNKKKKREETKQKAKMEKRIQRNNANTNAYYQNMLYQMNNIPQISYMDCFPNYFSYGYPNQFFFNPYIYYPQMQDIPRESLELSLQNMSNRGIINNIMGALYIKEEHEKMKLENKKFVSTENGNETKQGTTNDEKSKSGTGEGNNENAQNVNEVNKENQKENLSENIEKAEKAEKSEGDFQAEDKLIIDKQGSQLDSKKKEENKDYDKKDETKLNENKEGSKEIEPLEKEVDANNITKDI